MRNLRFICIMIIAVFMLGSVKDAPAQVKPQISAEANTQANAESEKKDPCAAYRSERMKFICRDRMQKIERMHDLKAKRQERISAAREQHQKRYAPSDPQNAPTAEQDPSTETPPVESEQEAEQAADPAADQETPAADEIKAEEKR